MIREILIEMIKLLADQNFLWYEEVKEFKEMMGKCDYYQLVQHQLNDAVHNEDFEPGFFDNLLNFLWIFTSNPKISYFTPIFESFWLEMDFSKFFLKPRIEKGFFQ